MSLLSWRIYNGNAQLSRGMTAPSVSRTLGAVDDPHTFSPRRVGEGGAADKAANLARWKSWCRQLPVFGRLAYPVRAEATKHVLPGCKSLGCPAAREQTSSCASASDGVRSDS